MDGVLYFWKFSDEHKLKLYLTTEDSNSGHSFIDNSLIYFQKPDVGKNPEVKELDYIRKMPNFVSGIGAFSAAFKDSPSTLKKIC